MIENYYRPKSTEEAEQLLQNQTNAVFLAGGTQVNRAYLEREIPSTVIDVQDAIPHDIHVQQGQLVVGAMIRLQDLADDPRVPEALAQAAKFIPTRSVRNQATLGGNIGAARPDSYLIPILIAMKAHVVTSSGESSVEDYLQQKKRDLISTVSVPLGQGAAKAVKESRSHLALPVVSAGVWLKGSSHDIQEARVVAGCVANHALRLTSVEEGLVSGALSNPDSVELAVGQAISPSPNLLGSQTYKTHVNSVVIAKAIFACMEALG